jgi:hypothetical protein
MKAAFIERHGGPEVLKFGEMPDPIPWPHPARSWLIGRVYPSVSILF